MVQVRFLKRWLSINPFSDDCRIAVGQTASPLPQTETQMNVSDWNNGMYYYGVYIEGQLVKQGQILIQN